MTSGHFEFDLNRKVRVVTDMSVLVRFYGNGDERRQTTPVGETHCAEASQNGQSLAEREQVRWHGRSCDKCGAWFKTAGNLKHHKGSIRYRNGMCHARRERKQSSTYACAQCGKKFARVDHRDTHVHFVHSTSVKAQECAACDVRYKRPEGLRRHNNTARCRCCNDMGPP